MDWDLEENTTNHNNNQNKNKTTKILLTMIILFVILIMFLMLLLLYIKASTFKLTVNNKLITEYAEDLIEEQDNTVYISLKDFATLIPGYSYHNGEYKEYSQDETKAYVESEYETASFYLNSNKVCKLAPDEITEDYEVFNVKENVKEINGKLYAPLEAIKIGFNVNIENTSKSMKITTLDNLVTVWNANAKEKGYELSTDFENQKALLYGYLVLKNFSRGTFGITDNKYNEIISSRYNEIEFIENTKEFLVTTSQNKVGIVDSQGKNKVNQIYDSIKLIDKEDEIYLVSYENKYGVIASNGQYIIYPEYDKIGVDTNIFKNLTNQYILLNNLIPVCKNQKWGAFDKKGTMILSNSYDGFGSSTSTGGEAVIEIPDVNGIVIKNGDLYGIISKEGKELIPIALKEVYSITSAGETKYYMNYRDNQMDVIEYINKNVK